MFETVSISACSVTFGEMATSAFDKNVLPGDGLSDNGCPSFYEGLFFSGQL